MGQSAVEPQATVDQDTDARLWERVFDLARLEDSSIPIFDERVKLVGALKTTAAGQRPDVLALFQFADKRFLAVFFHYESSWDEICELKQEVSHDFYGLLLIDEQREYFQRRLF